MAYQLLRAELVQQRDDLVARRDTLLLAISRNEQTMAHYNNQRHQLQVRERLQGYLRQNSEDFINNSNDSFVAENLNVLPSTDWTRRVDALKILYPNMEVQNASISRAYEDDGPAISTVTFSVASRGLPTLALEFRVRDETVLDGKLANTIDNKMAEHVLDKISPTVGQTLRGNYLLRGKMDLVMAMYNSLGERQRTRLDILKEILTRHQGWTRPKNWQDDSALLCVLYVELTLWPEAKVEQNADGQAQNNQTQNDKTQNDKTQNDKTQNDKTQNDQNTKKHQKDQLFVRLRWELVVENSEIGLVGSILDVEVVDENGMVVSHPADTFLRLVPTHGVCGAFSIVVRNLRGT